MHGVSSLWPRVGLRLAYFMSSMHRGVHLVENIETVRRACIGLVVIQVGEILSVCIYAHCVCNIQQELVDNIDLASNEI